MVSHLVRLRYRLMWNGLRRSTGSMVGAIFASLGFLYMIGMGYLLAFAAATTPTDVLPYTERGALLVLIGAVTMMIWAVGPIMFSVVNPFTDAKNFLVYGIPNKQFIPGVALGGIVAPTGLATLVLLLGAAVMWGWHPAAILAGVVSAVLGTVLCVLSMQVLIGLVTNIIRKRVVRDAIQLILLVPLMLAGFIMLGAIETIQEFWDLLPQIATWIAYTPAGFLAFPWLVAQSQWALAALHLVIMLGYVVLLGWAYNAIINKATESAGTSKERQRESTGLGLIGRANSPMKAIWARSLLYWFKDPRYAASLVIVVVFIVFGILEATVMDDSPLQVFTKVIPVIIAYLVGFSISADLSYDSTGFSLHITSGVRGIDDRLGRVFGLLTWALPLVVVLSLATAFATDSLQDLAAWMGMAIGVLLSSAAISAVSSARYIYPVPPPGTSPMAQPEGGMGRLMLIQTLSMLVQLLVVIPVIAVALVALLTDSQAWGIMTLMVGVLYGTGMLWAGVRLGAKWYDRALPETYQSIVRVSALY